MMGTTTLDNYVEVVFCTKPLSEQATDIFSGNKI